MDIAIVDVSFLVRNWWLVALRGLAGVVFGVVTFLAPGISLTALVMLFAAYALVDGVFALVSAVRRVSKHECWAMLVFQGVVGIVAGLGTIVWPGLTALALLYVIAAWAVVTGALEIAAAIRLRKEITGEWLLALSGVLSVALGVMMMAFPGSGALALVIFIGAYAFVTGWLLLVLGVKLRSFAKVVQPGTRERGPSTVAPGAQPGQQYT